MRALLALLLLACRGEPSAPAAPSEPGDRTPAPAPAPTPPPPATPPTIPPSSQPPAAGAWPDPPAALGSVYVQKGVCPGECCTYREWTATADVPVVASPGSTQQLGKIAKGEEVQAETGEVHVKPNPARVRRAHTLESGRGKAAVKPGDVVWVLAPIGEGFSHVWYEGQFYQAEALFICDERCETSEEASCWAYAQDTSCEPDPWWVKVRAAGGVTGWVDNTQDVLTGFDACG